MYQAWEQIKGGNASTTAETANVNAAAREGRNLPINTYQNKFLQGQNDHTSRLGTIAVFMIWTPLTRGAKSRTTQTRMGSIPFEYISRIDI
jgi:hypothetical protein